MRRLFAGMLVGLVFGAVLRAHDPGLSTLQVTATPAGVDFVMQFAPADFGLLTPVDANKDGRVDRGEFEAAKAVVGTFPQTWLRVVRAGAEQPVPIETVGSEFDEAGSNVLVRARSPVATAGTWTITLPRMPDLPPGHRQFVTVHGPDGAVLVERLVGVREPFVTIAWPAGSTSTAPGEGAGKGPAPTDEGGGNVSFGGFLKLGVEHILTGYDHLLFLAGLLVVCHRLRPVLAVITSFTVAHSITLALATLDIVNVPSRIVEPLIAASIVFVGVENILRRGEPRGRWALTFVFGLIHGFGFAGVLRELGVGEGGRALAVPLLSFNLGVELGQIGVAAIFLPLLWWAQRSPNFERRVLPVLSGLVAAAGLYWLLERTLG